MNEALAAPALLKIASDPAHPERELALSLLAKVATPQADAAFRSVDLSGFPAQVQTSARAAVADRPVFERRTPPKSTRQELVAVLEAIVEQRDFRPFTQLAERVPDGERDMVTVLGPADLPLAAAGAAGYSGLRQSAPDGRRLSLLYWHYMDTTCRRVNNEVAEDDPARIMGLSPQMWVKDSPQFSIRLILCFLLLLPSSSGTRLLCS